MTTSPFQAFKLTIMHATGLSRDALHVYVGLIVFFAVFWWFRERARVWRPFMAVLVVACLGELLDMRDDFGMMGAWRWQASLHDVLNTAFWPFVITLMIRFQQSPFGRSE